MRIIFLFSLPDKKSTLSKHENDPIKTFFNDSVEMARSRGMAGAESHVSIVNPRRALTRHVWRGTICFYSLDNEQLNVRAGDCGNIWNTNVVNVIRIMSLMLQRKNSPFFKTAQFTTFFAVEAITKANCEDSRWKFEFRDNEILLKWTKYQ